MGCSYRDFLITLCLYERIISVYWDLQRELGLGRRLIRGMDGNAVRYPINGFIAS